MVVLLCAGNRIAIPDFSEGLGAFFQPVHTMTGIIAQEMGEVVRGSIHYRALFMVGLVLFIHHARDQLRSRRKSCHALPHEHWLNDESHDADFQSSDVARAAARAQSPSGSSGSRPISILACDHATSFSTSLSKAARTVFTTTPPFINVAVPHRAAADALVFDYEGKKMTLSDREFRAMASGASRRRSRADEHRLLRRRNLALHRRHRAARHRLDGRSRSSSESAARFI